MKKYNDAYQAMKQLSKNSTPQYRIKEWLHNSGTGFGRLQSGLVIPSEMLQLTRSVGIPSWQEARQGRENKRFLYISWKSLHIPFDAKLYSNYHLKRGQKVSFGVGFTFTGPRATLLLLILAPVYLIVPIKCHPIMADNSLSSHVHVYWDLLKDGLTHKQPCVVKKQLHRQSITN